MHEHGLIKDLIAEVERVAAREGVIHVSALNVWIGADAHMTEAMFRVHFHHASEGSLVQNVALNVEVSNDHNDQNAAGIILQSIEAES